MGHKVNPENFRLGISVDWKYQLRDPLLANIFVYKMVKNMFLQYSAPYVSYNIRRNVNPRDHSIPLFDEDESNSTILLHEKKSMILNPFLENSFVFSHVNISYAPSMYLAIFLLDAAAERERIIKRRPESTFYYLSGKFYSKYRHFYTYFRKNILFTKLPRKYKNTTLYYNYKYLFTHLRSRLTAKRKTKLRKPYPMWLINQFSYLSYKHRLSNIVTNLRILRFLLRYLRFYKRTFSKKRLFYFNTLIVTILSLLALLPKSVFSKRLFLFLNLCYVYLTSFRYLHLQYNKKIFQSRLYLFQVYAKILTYSLHKIIFFSTDRRFIVKFYGLHNRNLNANFLLNYFLIKLGQYFILNDILQPIIHRLQNQGHVKGFRLIFSGRLTRKERAAYIVKSFRSMPLATYNTRVDYASDFKIMKFGVVGIKVYLLYDKAPPYYYFFEFRTKL